MTPDNLTSEVARREKPRGDGRIFNTTRRRRLPTVVIFAHDDEVVAFHNVVYVLRPVGRIRRSVISDDDDEGGRHRRASDRISPPKRRRVFPDGRKLRSRCIELFSNRVLAFPHLGPGRCRLGVRPERKKQGWKAVFDATPPPTIVGEIVVLPYSDEIVILLPIYVLRPVGRRGERERARRAARYLRNAGARDKQCDGSRECRPSQCTFSFSTATHWFCHVDARLLKLWRWRRRRPRRREGTRRESSVFSPSEEQTSR